MYIHEIIRYQNPYLLKVLCKQFNLDEKKLRPFSGNKADYYDFEREMVTDSEGQRLNYGW